MSQQLNIFMENRPGRLKTITEILSQSGVNIRAFTIQDRGDFGMMKLIVNKPRQAHLALAEKQFACALKDILAVSIPDQPGNLNKLTSILSDNEINIVDAYGIVLEPNKRGICCVELEKVEDLQRSRDLLNQAGFDILQGEDLYEF